MDSQWPTDLGPVVEDDQPRERSTLARLGILLLNLLTPGLGLIRIGRVRYGAACIAVIILASLIFVCVYWLTPSFSYSAWIMLAGFLAVTTIGLLFWSMIKSWQLSRLTSVGLPIISRWYSLLALVAVYTLGGDALRQFGQSMFSAKYMAADSMAPTLLRGDRFLLAMRRPERLRRGMIVGVDGASGVYIYRLVGLPGELIEMRAGQVWISGHAIEQRPAEGVFPELSHPAADMRMLEERFPDEPFGHRILDLGIMEGDNFGPITVPQGHYFVLGDNRDMSADSRFGPELTGIAMVPLAAIHGEVQFITWSTHSGRAGLNLQSDANATERPNHGE